MYLFNTTIKIDHKIVDELLQFITQIHFQEVKQSGLVTSIDLYKIDENDLDGNTYSLQYKFHSAGTFDQFYSLYDVKFKKYLNGKYAFEVVFFSTILKKETKFDFKKNRKYVRSNLYDNYVPIYGNFVGSEQYTST